MRTKAVCTGRALVLMLTALLTFGACTWSGGGAVYVPQAEPPDPSLAPYVVTDEEVVKEMLRVVGVGKDDVVYDLGSGDGRIIITAARLYGARGVGFELDPELVRRARDNARRANVSHLVEFRQQDVLTVDLSPATVVTVYLSREANLKLRPRLLTQLRTGSRVISHEFDMGDWSPTSVHRVRDDAGGFRTLYLWRIESRRSRETGERIDRIGERAETERDKSRPQRVTTRWGLDELPPGSVRKPQIADPVGT